MTCCASGAGGSHVTDNAEVIRNFYRAFQRLDPDAMAACYADDVEFTDEVFRGLRGDRARAMWRMLLTRGSDLEVDFSDVRAEGDRGSAKWTATYTFGTTGRRVRNEISAEFAFRDGKIVRHRDRFDFWRWSRMALGPVGLALGWTPLVRGMVRAQANRLLEKFIARSR